MTDPSETTLAGDYVTISVTIGSTASALATLASSALATAGYSKTSEILQVTILGYQSASASERAAILYGGADDQLGYLPAGDERVFPVRGNRVYVKRAGGSDVPAVLEVFLRKQQ
jgi:hypothetical protein